MLYLAANALVYELALLDAEGYSMSACRVLY